MPVLVLVILLMTVGFLLDLLRTRSNTPEFYVALILVVASAGLLVYTLVR